MSAAESPGVAGNRMYYMSGPNFKWRSSLMECMQMKGETVIDLSRIRLADRKKMIRATQKGYARATNAFWVMMLNVIAEKGRVQVPIGYLGKNNAQLYVPVEEIADLHEEMVALIELTGEFDSGCITKGPEYDPNRSWQMIRIHIGYNQSDKMREGEHLQSHFKSIGPQIDRILEQSLSARQPMIDYLQSSEIITLPHDSHNRDPDKSFI
jgi:hypothetical protein